MQHRLENRRTLGSKKLSSDILQPAGVKTKPTLSVSLVDYFQQDVFVSKWSHRSVQTPESLLETKPTFLQLRLLCGRIFTLQMVKLAWKYGSEVSSLLTAIMIKEQRFQHVLQRKQNLSFVGHIVWTIRGTTFLNINMLVPPLIPTDKKSASQLHGVLDR